jgi:hypothetical protein
MGWAICVPRRGAACKPVTSNIPASKHAVSKEFRGAKMEPGAFIFPRSYTNLRTADNVVPHRLAMGPKTLVFAPKMLGDNPQSGTFQVEYSESCTPFCLKYEGVLEQVSLQFVETNMDKEEVVEIDPPGTLPVGSLHSDLMPYPFRFPDQDPGFERSHFPPFLPCT